MACPYSHLRPFTQMGYVSGSGAGRFIADAIMYGANAGRSNTQVAKRIQLAPYNAAGGGGLMAFGRS